MQVELMDILLSTHSDPAQMLINLIDTMPGGFFIYRADGNEELLHANDAVLKIFGCDTYDEFVELTGNSFRGMVYRNDLEEVERKIAHQIAVNDNKMDYVEYRINH